MSSARTVKELVEPAAGEAVIAAGTFAPVGVRSTFMSVLRLARRATGAGGLAAQFQINNFIAVTESRVLLWQGNSGLGELIVEWPRGAVSGTAKRKHWVGAGEQLRDKWFLRSTMTTPDGQVVLDIDENGGGRNVLRKLGIDVPKRGKSKWWWATGPDN
jgi:hypothetical protein